MSGGAEHTAPQAPPRRASTGGAPLPLTASNLFARHPTSGGGAGVGPSTPSGVPVHPVHATSASAGVGTSGRRGSGPLSMLRHARATFTTLLRKKGSEDVRHRELAVCDAAVRHLAVHIEEPDHVGTEGLYRIPGDATKVDAVCVYLLTCENLLAVDWADMRAKHTVHDLCSVMKALLRRCKEPLVPYAAYDAWLAAGQADSDAEVLAALRKSVQALPAANQCTCIRLMTHLHRVAAHASANKMTPSALAACWVPSLMRREEASVSEFVEVPILARAVALFITHADEWKLASPTAAPVAWPASVPVVAATAERDVLLVSLLHMCTAALEDAAVPPSIYGVLTDVHTVRAERLVTEVLKTQALPEIDSTSTTDMSLLAAIVLACVKELGAPIVPTSLDALFSVSVADVRPSAAGLHFNGEPPKPYTRQDSESQLDKLMFSNPAASLYSSYTARSARNAVDTSSAASGTPPPLTTTLPATAARTPVPQLSLPVNARKTGQPLANCERLRFAIESLDARPRALLTLLCLHAAKLFATCGGSDKRESKTQSARELSEPSVSSARSVASAGGAMSAGGDGGHDEVEFEINVLTNVYFPLVFAQLPADAAVPAALGHAGVDTEKMLANCKYALKLMMQFPSQLFPPLQPGSQLHALAAGVGVRA